MKAVSSNNRTIITAKPEFLVNPEDKSIRKGKTVVCLNTGEFFKSGKEAAIKHDIKYASMNANLIGRTKTVKGKKFMYVADLSFRINDITGYIMDIKAKETSMAEKVREAEEAKARAEAETQRVKGIWQKFTDEIKEAAPVTA